jgi:hypothetical protein
MRKKNTSCEPKNFYMPIPSGVAYSIIAEAVNRFGVELVEKDITLPGSAKDEMVPKAWILKGDKSSLEKSREFMAKRIQEQLKSFE